MNLTSLAHAMTSKQSDEHLAVRPDEHTSGASDEMLRRLAHELRAPIGAIAACAEVMRDERLGPLGNDQYRDYADTIHSSADHALEVIVSTMELNRDEPSEDAQHEPTDLVDLVDRATEMMSAAAHDAEVAMVRLPTSAPLLVGIDPTAMMQIVLNLLSNAIKFTPPKGRITINVRQDDAGSTVLSVADNGIGIAPRELSRLASGGSDSGYGLSMIHALAEKFGATVAITSERGHGTEVQLMFAAPAGHPGTESQ